MSKTRVRFAPSPTGFFHIGSARTALFNWLYARHTGGTFVLRIEDTDHDRNSDEFLRLLIDSMQWLGLDWDEGPEVGGDFGPYFQSKRSAIYEEYIEKLKAKDRVYEKDGALWLRIEGERVTEFDKHKNCDVERVLVEPTVNEDLIRGRVEQKVDQDFVIVRSDGNPVFHFVNVVDDITMGITHVIRGEDHLTNTSKHIELFKAFDAELPKFAHIPLILKSTGKGKMSKRDEGALIEDYQKRGFLAEAVRNYIALLGWNPKDDNEIFTGQELIERFDLDGVNSSGARFDEQKMSHVNTEHLRRLPVGNLAWMATPLLVEAGLIDEETDEDYIHRVLGLCREKIKNLEDLPEFLNFFFKDDFQIDEKTLNKLSKKGDPKEKLAEALPALQALESFDSASIDACIDTLATEKERKKFDYFPVLRLAVSGQGGGVDLLGLLETLGQERVSDRIESFLKNEPA